MSNISDHVEGEDGTTGKSTSSSSLLKRSIGNYLRRSRNQGELRHRHTGVIVPKGEGSHLDFLITTGKSRGKTLREQPSVPRRAFQRFAADPYLRAVSRFDDERYSKKYIKRKDESLGLEQLPADAGLTDRLMHSAVRRARLAAAPGGLMHSRASKSAQKSRNWNMSQRTAFDPLYMPHTLHDTQERDLLQRKTMRKSTQGEQPPPTAKPSGVMYSEPVQKEGRPKRTFLEEEEPKAPTAGASHMLRDGNSKSLRKTMRNTKASNTSRDKNFRSLRKTMRD